MNEAGQNSIHEQRSRPNRESLAHMKFLRDSLADITQEIPQVRGLAFFGSRSRGQDRKDPNNLSDLDTVVFYDGSHFTDNNTFEMFDNDGNTAPDFIQRNEQYQGDKRRHRQLQEQIKEQFGTLMKQHGLPVDIYSDFPGANNGTVLVEDISKDATDRAVKRLEMYVDANNSDGSIPIGVINSPAFSIASRFLLAAGEAVYQNRKYILDRLEQVDEKYFKGLMNCLRELQTGDQQLPKKLPQSLQEARRFYNVK